MINNEKLIFRLHALSRMAQRGFEPSDVRSALDNGMTIEQYPDDTPYPSFLVMAKINGRPIHVVASLNEAEQEIIIITVYEPDPMMWTDQFSRRKT